MYYYGSYELEYLFIPFCLPPSHCLWCTQLANALHGYLSILFIIVYVCVTLQEYNVWRLMTLPHYPIYCTWFQPKHKCRTCVLVGTIVKFIVSIKSSCSSHFMFLSKLSLCVLPLFQHITNAPITQIINCTHSLELK